MAKIIVKSSKFGIVVKELDTASYKDEMALVQDLLQAIPEADWFEGKSNGDGINWRVSSNAGSNAGSPISRQVTH